MATKSRKAATGAPKSALTKRYGSLAEIKREFFPNAAAEEAAAAVNGGAESGYEALVDDFFGPGQQQPGLSPR